MMSAVATRERDRPTSCGSMNFLTEAITLPA
jgi:hypothetical protein